MRLVRFLLSGVLAVVLPYGLADAALAADGDSSDCVSTCTTAAAGHEGVDVSAHSQQVTGRRHASQPPSSGDGTWTTVEEDMAPTCFGNARGDAEALCGSAVNSCPDPLIRFWVWHRVTSWTRKSGVTTSQVGQWYQENGTFCLGADDPGVPTIAKAIAQVRSDFAHLPLAAAQVRSDPGPTTVVNFETAFSAGTSEPQTFNPVLLGYPVHVTAKPVEWRWTWGDGATETTTTPGVPRKPVVTHTYTHVGDAPVSVVVKFVGTFSVGTDPTQYDIASPAFSPPSTPTIVKVCQARTQLVSR